MYSQEFLDKMRAQLEQEKSQLEEDLRATSPNPEMDTQSADDVAEKLEVDIPNQEIIAQLKSDLVKVEAALARLDGGTYGQTSAGGYLSEDRLEALPWAEDQV